MSYMLFTLSEEERNALSAEYADTWVGGYQAPYDFPLDPGHHVPQGYYLDDSFAPVLLNSKSFFEPPGDFSSAPSFAPRQMVLPSAYPFKAMSPAAPPNPPMPNSPPGTMMGLPSLSAVSKYLESAPSSPDTGPFMSPPPDDFDDKNDDVDPRLRSLDFRGQAPRAPSHARPQGTQQHLQHISAPPTLAVNDIGNVALWITALDRPASYVTQATPRAGGVPEQLVAPGPFIIDATGLIVQWSVGRRRGEQFFRLHSSEERMDHEEIAGAMAVLQSRPPRRINRYAAPVILTQIDDSVCLLGPSQATRQILATSPPDFSRTETPNAYRPRYTKGEGRNKLGWCDNCADGGYFKVKNSGYLYHKNHEHGILANGNVMEDPLVLRLGTENRWEGLCGICYRWVLIDNHKRQSWSTWFRHYNHCCKEYDELKAAVFLANPNATFAEIEYCPYANSD